MGRTQEKVSVQDDYGDVHTYLLTPMSTEDGCKVMSRISKPLIRALTGALAALTSGAPSSSSEALKDALGEREGGDGEDEFGLDPEPKNGSPTLPAVEPEEEAEIDFVALGISLEQLVDIALKNGDGRFYRFVLKGAIRFQGGIEKGGQDVSRGPHFDAIYRANYGELFIVLGHVLKLNFGPMFKRVVGNVGGLSLVQGGVLSRLRDTLTGSTAPSLSEQPERPA